MADGSRSSVETTTPLWVRVALPSAADLIFVALLCVMVFTPLSARLLGDAGIGWHIRAGQQILATRMVPRVDPFSSSRGGRRWLAWEWLYDMVVGQLEASVGLNGVVWFTSIVIATVFAWIFRLLILRGTNVLVALALVLLALSASMIHFLARPHVLSWWLALAWFWILESWERQCLDGHGGQDRDWLWTLPLLMLVWVNVHGGFLVGFVLLGIFWAAAAWNWLRARPERLENVFPRVTAGRRIRTLGSSVLLSAAVSLVNPYGLGLHAHVYSYLSNRFLMDHIEEFKSPDFHGVAQRCFLILLLVTLAALAARGRELRLSERLTVLFAVSAGLYASRNIPISSALLVMVVAPLLSSPEAGRGFFHRMASVEREQRGHVWPIFIVVAAFLIAGGGGRLASSLGMDAHFDAARMPVDAVDYLKKHEVKGPVLSPDYWGGYLIYRLYPETKVVLDDRHDLYGDEFFKPYLKMMRGEPGWEEFLREHMASCIVLPREAALTSLLVKDSEWRPIYTDAVAVVFARSSLSPEQQN